VIPVDLDPNIPPNLLYPPGTPLVARHPGVTKVAALK